MHVIGKVPEACDVTVSHTRSKRLFSAAVAAEAAQLIIVGIIVIMSEAASSAQDDNNHHLVTVSTARKRPESPVALAWVTINTTNRSPKTQNYL